MPSKTRDLDPEIGAELAVGDLKPRMIVVIQPPERDFYLSMWVHKVTPEAVVFWSGVQRWTVINFVRDGRLVDDQNREVRVFEYLGSE